MEGNCISVWGYIINRPLVEMTEYSKGKQMTLRSILVSRKSIKTWEQKCLPVRRERQGAKDTQVLAWYSLLSFTWGEIDV